MRWLVLVLPVICVGCDVQGPDLDIDGIEDADDDCLATFKDLDYDADLDGKTADFDLCPHDANAVAGDIDEDGIPDACDPFPGVTSPDTRRCVTSFSLRYMNTQAFTTRPGELGWDLHAPLTARGNDTVSIISTHEYDFTSTTYDIHGDIHFRDADSSSSFRVWLRALPMPSNQDVACGIDGGNNLYVYASNARHSIVQLPVLVNGTFRLRATVQAGSGSNVLCRVSANGMSIATTFSTALQPGYFGFSSIATDVTVDSVVIDTRDMPVPF